MPTVVHSLKRLLKFIAMLFLHPFQSLPYKVTLWPRVFSSSYYGLIVRPSGFPSDGWSSETNAAHKL